MLGVSELQFDEEGFFGHTRAIERLALMFNDIGYHGGDGNQSGSVTNNYQISTGTGQNTNMLSTTASGASGSSGSTVGYIGTLNVPVFGGSTTVTGNAAGVGAVDWQQSRALATQVASGNYSFISGGKNNTASNDYSFCVGNFNTSSGYESSCIGYNCTASNTGSFSIGNGTFVSGSDSYAFGTNCGSSGASSLAIFGNSGNANKSYVIGADIVYSAFTTSINNLAISHGPLGFNKSYLTDGCIRNIIVGSISDSNGTGTGTYNTLNNTIYLGLSLTTAGIIATNSIVINSGRTISSSLSTAISFDGSLYLNSSFTHNGALATGASGDSFICCSPTPSRVFFASDIWPSSSTVDSFTYKVYIGNTSGPTLITGANASISISPSNVFFNIASSTQLSITGTSVTVAQAFACNGKTAQSSFASGGAAAASPAVYNQASDQLVRTLVNNIRTALVNNGIMT